MTKLPIAFSGIPIKGINNPILVLWAEFINTNSISYKLTEEFHSTFKEATGFSCKKAFEQVNSEKVEGPYSSYYVYATKRFVDQSEILCDIPMSENEKFETLKLIDEALYGENSLIKALRTAQRYNSSLLFREGEEPVIIHSEDGKFRYLYSFPLSGNTNYIDDALIHLSGTLVLDFVSSFSEKLIDVENSLWDLVYSIKVPYGKFKVIWDLDRASIVEIINLPRILFSEVQ
ncbi:MAG: hypothetical protein JZD40_05055 [Sulfolobus sp.]|nr:hypothetical protein [Sulfolobus sp.]